MSSSFLVISTTSESKVEHWFSVNDTSIGKHECGGGIGHDTSLNGDGDVWKSHESAQYTFAFLKDK